MHSPSRKWQIKHIKSKRLWDVLRIWESRLAQPNTWKTKIQEFEVFGDLGSTTGNELHNRPGNQVLRTRRVELNIFLVKHSICRKRCIKEIPVWSDDFADKFLLFGILWVKWGPSGETRDTDWLLLLILHCTRLHLNTLHYTIMHCNTLNYTAMSHCILMLPLSEWTR